MKKFATAMLMVAGSSFVQADYVVKSADGSELSQLCVASTHSRAELQKTAAGMGLTNADLGTVLCNGMNVHRFAAKYGKLEVTGVRIGYILKGADASEATALCIAAASSEQEFEQVKARYFASEAKIESEVLCNGQPLKTFARKYSGSKPALSISQR